ncbi:MAG: 2TM domain-containing protein [Microbacterium pygmaeum]
MSDDQLRDRALHSLKAKRGFSSLLITWVVLSALFTVIWLLTGGPSSGGFWPVWPIAGIGIAVVFSAVSAFGGGSGTPSEAQIQSEMDRLKGS